MALPKKSSTRTKNTVKATKAPTKKTTKTAKDDMADTPVSGKGKALVIVESPAKAKTINKYLGSGYIVRSSVGHVRDLPVSGTGKAEKADESGLSREQKAYNALVRRMGVNPENDWQAVYEILPNKTKVIKELKALAKTLIPFIWQRTWIVKERRLHGI